MKPDRVYRNSGTIFTATDLVNWWSLAKDEAVSFRKCPERVSALLYRPLVRTRLELQITLRSANITNPN